MTTKDDVIKCTRAVVAASLEEIRAEQARDAAWLEFVDALNAYEGAGAAVATCMAVPLDEVIALRKVAALAETAVRRWASDRVDSVVIEMERLGHAVDELHAICGVSLKHPPHPSHPTKAVKGA